MGWMKQAVHRFRGKSTSGGFALPTVLVASVVMMMVLLAALTGVSSVSSGIRNQYIDQIGRSAAKSGFAMANACIKKNSGNITWTDAKPLKPNTDCTGTETTTCPGTSTNAVCYVLKNGNFRTTFSVGVVTDAGNNPTDIDVKGIVREVRKTSGEVLRESRSSIKGKLSGINSSAETLSLTAMTYGDASYPNNSGHACAIADAQVYCWGNNSIGQLGDGTTTTRSVPTLVSGLAGKTVTKVKVASNFNAGYGNSRYGSTCAIADAQLYCWGEKGYVGGSTTTTPTLFTELSGKTVGASSSPGASSSLLFY